MQDPVITESREPYFECSWFASHPGDKIEAKIILELKKQQKLITGDYSIFISADGSVIFIRWYAHLNTGIVVALHIFGENSAVVPVQNWAQYVMNYHVSSPNTGEELLQIYQDPKVVIEEETPGPVISEKWLQASLEGKEIIIKENTSKEALSYFISIIETMPWSVYLLEFARLSRNRFNIKFMGNDLEEPLPYDELFITLTQGTNNQFWNLTFKLLSALVIVNEENWFSSIRNTLMLIQQITRPEQDAKDCIEIIKESIHDILDLDLEYGENYITSCFSNLAVQYPQYETCKSLLDLASSISQSQFTDLIKLAEGTALQIAFILEDAQKREEIFLIVTERSKTWGIEHLVGYIQSVTGILSETEENRQVLAKIVQLSEDQLSETWDGSLCLVETNIVAGEFQKAFELRLQAIDLLTDKFMKAEDTINAIKWAVKLEGLDEGDLIKLAFPILGEAFVSIPIGDMFQSSVDSLLDEVIQYDKSKLLSAIITWFSTNLEKIGMNDRNVLLKSLDNRFSTNKKYSQLLVQVRLILFNHYLENPQEFGYEVAEEILRVIYNNVDPSKKSANELISTITRWIILASTRYNRPELIDEARTRFELLMTEKEFARRSLIEIFARAVQNRLKIPRSKLRKSGVGAKILEEILDLGHIVNDSQILLEIIPDAQELLLKKQAYELYAKYSLIEMEILQASNGEWLDTIASTTQKLVEAGEINATNLIFDRILGMQLTPEQEIRVLSIQLEFVEIEPDLIDAEMIFDKRQRLIEIQGDDVEDIEEDILLAHYRNGISELMSKGDVTHLNEFLLQAIVFCDKKNLTAITEFSNILLDSFETNLDFYLQSKSTEIYSQLMKMFRQINSTFTDRDQTMPLKASNMLIKANLDLFENLENPIFLIRAQLVSKEIAFVIRDTEVEKRKYSEIDKQRLIITFQKLMQYMIENNPVFGTVDAALLASQFFYSINESTQIFYFTDQTLSLLKKGYVNAKLSNSNIIFGILLLSEIFLLIDGAIIEDLNGLLQERAVKLVNVGLASSRGEEIQKELLGLKSRLLSSPQQTFQEFPFEIENFLQINDFSI
jgi:hypothetical protein